MTYKMGLNLVKNYSCNFSLPKRNKKIIKFIIIHYTGMKKESDAIKRLCNLKSKVSANYFIKNNGQILTLVPDLYESWHAGISNWKSFKLLNKYSIGIEISNPGHSHGYKNFNPKQITSVKKLLGFLIKKYKINYKNVLGHSDIAPNRKKDPGEKFPWIDLGKSQLCHWHKLSLTELRKYRKIRLSEKEKIKFFVCLYKVGYKKITGLNIKKNNIYLTKAFQRRFRQDLVDGIIDMECFLIAKSLLK